MTTPTTALAGDTRPGPATDLVDADGHVFEDVAGIVQRLPAQYREVREREVQMSRRGATPKLFPALGYLTNMPFVISATDDRHPEETGLDQASWQYFLQTVGIDRTVLYPTLGLTVGRIRDHEYAIAVCRAYNDWLAEAYLQHPSGRFQAAALLPMQVPDAAAAELRRAVTELGFSAGVLPSNGLTTHLGSEQYFPVYATAADLDVGLACHGGDGHDGLAVDDLNVYAAAHALGHPFSLLRSLAGMLFNGVFQRFPGLRVAYLEGGAAWILLATERFAESSSALRPVPSPRLLEMPAGTNAGDHLTDLLHRGRVVLGCEGGEQSLTTAIATLGCAPFMFSSDFPHEVSAASCRREVDELDELDIDDTSRALLKAGTARAFYRL
jgi:predicted TIM-barrel fold metal-dependent hydrolase